MAIRSALKSGIKKVLGMQSPAAAPPPATPAWRAETDKQPVPYPKQDAAPPPAKAEPAPRAEATPKAEAAPKAEPAPAPVAEPAAEAAPVSEAAEAARAPEAAPAAEAASDVVGPALTMEALEEIMDEMVRPALQGDGGDITLVKVENNDVYVKLVGSCKTCPSSVMTMKMGVEALLKEEFPQMGNLIQVE